MNGMINTVCGPISSGEIGTTLMHEHIQYAYVGWYAHTNIKNDKKKIFDVAMKAWRISRPAA